MDKNHIRSVAEHWGQILNECLNSDVKDRLVPATD